MNYLFDTSAVLIHFQDEAGAEVLVEILGKMDSKCYLCAVSLVELARKFKEIGLSNEEVDLTLSGYLSLFDEIVPVDVEVAAHAREVAEKTPERLPLVDSLIAGAAKSVEACLVHRDKHLAAIPGTVLKQVSVA